MSKTITDRIWSNMVEVKGGIFQMGGTREQWGEGAHVFELPVHSVKIDTFRICRFQLTQGEWQILMGDNPSHFRGDSSLPVDSISWEDAEFFLAHLNSLTTGGYRFPTEAEWEYAARGGALSRKYKYSGSNNVDEVAWTYNNSNGRTHPVGRLKPNELGLYDMSGNVWEWCNDWYGDYQSKPLINPLGPASGEHRVVRGGCWSNGPDYKRVSHRNYRYPGHRHNDYGFRLAFQG
jgi:formylglycine-generating enzyme required for sulfatase activity